MDFLIKLRKKKKITGSDMARILGISKVFYWQIEHGQRRLSYEMALRIAYIFDMKPDELFYDYFFNNFKKTD